MIQNAPRKARQVEEREREKDSHSKFTAGMGEVSESPSGNKSIRYLNSHYADVASRNKESIAKREREKEDGEPSEERVKEGLIRELG